MSAATRDDWLARWLPLIGAGRDGERNGATDAGKLLAHPD
jgi:hypothetical protein